MAQREGQKISPFYRTSSDIGAAALLPPMKTKEVEQGKGTADHFMGYLLNSVVHYRSLSVGGLVRASTSSSNRSVFSKET